MKITVIGGANIDITGVSVAPLRERDSNPAKVHLSGGGVARNMACNLARLGAEVTFVSAIGDDGFGRLLRESMTGPGLDDSALSLRLIVRKGLATGLYLVLLEPSGQMFVAVNDMAAVESIGPADVEALADTVGSSDLVAVDANLRPETLEALRRLTVPRGIPLMADAVSVSKAERLRAILPSLALLKANRAEAAALAGFPLDTDEALREGCRKLSGGKGAVYVTLGKEGSCCACGDVFFKQPVLPAVLVNVNGAGDAFAAGAAYHFCLGQGLEETAVFASACAAVTVESGDGVNEALTLERVLERVARYSASICK
ncbi:MAG: PfkB family carbohydrate kinase [Spirochaetaceae bacterium]|jgi:pseudouridine kinase|nr:PfkB family carbohydrate kinase [Spirochaetaceae bacterium]